MCGRYVLKATLQQLTETYGAEPEGIYTLEPNYNVAPSAHMPVVLELEGRRLIRPHRWGLIPFWADSVKTGYSMINARAETLAEKKSFKGPFASQRCIVPANGFYEWKTTKSAKAPHFIKRKKPELMHFAGLYGQWNDGKGEIVDSYTIITTRANKPASELHDRMPAMLLPGEFNTWLDPSNNNLTMLGGLLRPWPDDDTEFYRVSDEVGNVRNNRPELLEPYSGLFS